MTLPPFVVFFLAPHGLSKTHFLRMLEVRELLSNSRLK
jgi:hypothetical protein